MAPRIVSAYHRKLVFHGLHYMDALQWLTGDTVGQISAMVTNVGGSPIENEDAAVATFRLRRTGYGQNGAAMLRLNSAIISDTS